MFVFKSIICLEMFDKVKFLKQSMIFVIVGLLIVPDFSLKLMVDGRVNFKETKIG